MTLLSVLAGTFSDITNSGTAKTIVSVLSQATWLIWAEEGSCLGRRLPTDGSRAPVSCAVITPHHGLMAGEGDLHPAGELCLTPRSRSMLAVVLFWVVTNV